MLENLEKLRVYLPPLDACQLKKLAVVTMLIDHITCIFLERVYTADGSSLYHSLPQGSFIDGLGRAVGRQAFPIFCFFLVEGFLHTSSRLRYFMRLVFFAALSQIPFQKGFFPRTASLRANVLVTLALGLLAIWVLEELGSVLLPAGETFPAGAVKGGRDSDQSRAREEEEEKGDEPEKVAEGGALCLDGPVFLQDRRVFGAFLWAISGVGTVYGFCRLAYMLHSDYSYGGILTIVAMYLLYRYRTASLCVSWLCLSWYNKTEIYSAPAFFLLAGYNGKRGNQKKYFFYIFYPAHILILWLLRRHFFGR